MPFNAMLKTLRLKKGLTQGELAKITGLTRSAIGMYEAGNREPKYEVLELLADFFNVDMNTLLCQSIVESKPIQLELSNEEIQHIKKYRQLDADGKDRIDRQIDFELYQLENSAQKDERNLG